MTAVRAQRTWQKQVCRLQCWRTEIQVGLGMLGHIEWGSDKKSSLVGLRIRWMVSIPGASACQVDLAGMRTFADTLHIKYFEDVERP